MKPTLRLPYGLHGQQLLPATTVANGLACQCTCPGCGARLVARNGGTKKIAHFAHYQAPECAHGVETALHLLAKEVFTRVGQVRLPGYQGELYFSAEFLASFPFDARPFCLELQYETLEMPTEYKFPPQYVPILGVALERRTGAVVPDVVLQTPRGELLVEVAVTHFIDAPKLARLTELGLSTIEIDLSRMARTLAGEELEHLLVHDVETKRWALNLPLATWVAQRQRQFEEEARPYFWKLERRRLAAEQARKKEEQARRREALYQVALAEARKRELKPVMEWHIAHLPSSSQIISCPRPVRNRGGQAFSNVELDCQRCRYYRGREASWYIRCAHDWIMLTKRGAADFPLPEELPMQ